MRLIFQFLVLFASLMASAANETPTVDISVKFDRSFFKLKYDGTALSYSEETRQFKINVRSCNRSRLEKIPAHYNALLKKFKNQKPPLQKTKYDVEVTDSLGRKIQIARGSALGTWLRELPKKIMYDDAEARVACKH